MILHKAILITTYGTRIDVEVEHAHEAAIVYVTRFGVRARVFYYNSQHVVYEHGVRIPSFSECTVACITGLDERLEPSVVRPSPDPITVDAIVRAWWAALPQPRPVRVTAKQACEEACGGQATRVQMTVAAQTLLDMGFRKIRRPDGFVYDAPAALRNTAESAP